MLGAAAAALGPDVASRGGPDVATVAAASRDALGTCAGPLSGMAGTECVRAAVHSVVVHTVAAGDGMDSDTAALVRSVAAAPVGDERARHVAALAQHVSTSQRHVLRRVVEDAVAASSGPDGGLEAPAPETRDAASAAAPESAAGQPDVQVLTFDDPPPPQHRGNGEIDRLSFGSGARDGDDDDLFGFDGDASCDGVAGFRDVRTALLAISGTAATGGYGGRGEAHVLPAPPRGARGTAPMLMHHRYAPRDGADSSDGSTDECPPPAADCDSDTTSSSSSSGASVPPPPGGTTDHATTADGDVTPDVFFAVLAAVPAFDVVAFPAWREIVDRLATFFAPTTPAGNDDTAVPGAAAACPSPYSCDSSAAVLPSHDERALIAAAHLFAASGPGPAAALYGKLLAHTTHDVAPGDASLGGKATVLWRMQLALPEHWGGLSSDDETGLAALTLDYAATHLDALALVDPHAAWCDAWCRSMHCRARLLDACVARGFVARVLQPRLCDNIHALMLFCYLAVPRCCRSSLADDRSDGASAPLEQLLAASCEWFCDINRPLDVAALGVVVATVCTRLGDAESAAARRSGPVATLVACLGEAAADAAQAGDVPRHAALAAAAATLQELLLPTQRDAGCDDTETTPAHRAAVRLLRCATAADEVMNGPPDDVMALLCTLAADVSTAHHLDAALEWLCDRHPCCGMCERALGGSDTWESVDHMTAANVVAELFEQRTPQPHTHTDGPDAPSDDGAVVALLKAADVPRDVEGACIPPAFVVRHACMSVRAALRAFMPWAAWPCAARDGADDDSDPSDADLVASSCVGWSLRQRALWAGCGTQLRGPAEDHTVVTSPYDALAAWCGATAGPATATPHVAAAVAFGWEAPSVDATALPALPAATLAAAGNDDKDDDPATTWNTAVSAWPLAHNADESPANGSVAATHAAHPSVAAAASHAAARVVASENALTAAAVAAALARIAACCTNVEEARPWTARDLRLPALLIASAIARNTKGTIAAAVGRTERLITAALSFARRSCNKSACDAEDASTSVVAVLGAAFVLLLPPRWAACSGEGGDTTDAVAAAATVLEATLTPAQRRMLDRSGLTVGYCARRILWNGGALSHRRGGSDNDDDDTHALATCLGTALRSVATEGGASVSDAVLANVTNLVTRAVHGWLDRGEALATAAGCMTDDVVSSSGVAGAPMVDALTVGRRGAVTALGAWLPGVVRPATAALLLAERGHTW